MTTWRYVLHNKNFWSSRRAQTTLRKDHQTNKPTSYEIVIWPTNIQKVLKERKAPFKKRFCSGREAMPSTDLLLQARAYEDKALTPTVQPQNKGSRLCEACPFYTPAPASNICIQIS
uniref:Uncharacterized protein n=1 Tax=Palpitomonas bilix TaxID=652834 RepID=A0A7S3GJE4_9EUKA|mmetsp:Transcript_5846/g.13853  ORF Transcript_5846/g.13853 Transcript_5846/m.13853 type:complete len:117 (+) Transcript_5846:630-980(+)